MGKREDALAFLQRLIQTPSLPGQEGEIARIVIEEMRRLGYDDTWTDEAGNVLGVIRGRGEAPAVMFNTHLDHVDPGDPASWPSYGQPYSGNLHEGKVWGRGASDIKGPLAAQVYGVAGLIGGERPPGDVYVTADVQEEVGGLGARVLGPAYRDAVRLVVIGEPSSNEIRRGHRGRAELQVHVRGRSVHASVPEQSANPLYVIAGFLDRLRTFQPRSHEDLGKSSVAPTLIRSDQQSTNVTPGEIWLTLDWRTIPGETAEACREQVRPLLEASLIEGTTGEIAICERAFTSYTGYQATYGGDFPAFSLPETHPAIRAARGILSDAFGREVPVRLWRFATDGGHFAQEGMTVIGFGPGDESVVHTVREHIDLAEWEEAMRGNEILAREWPRRVAALEARGAGDGA